MEKLAEMNGTMKKIAEIYQNRNQVALLLPNGLIEVIISREGTYFFSSMSEFVNHPLASRIMTDEVIYFRFE